MIKVGDYFPSHLTLKKITGNTIEDFPTGNLLKGKIVLFAVPGAFTPTCSNAHLPSFLKALPTLKEHGIKDVYCIAVNDHFVMQAWGEKYSVEDKISFLADFDGALTEALGLILDATGGGLGKRSHRYAMILQDGIVQKLNVEDNPSECKISSGERLFSL